MFTGLLMSLNPRFPTPWKPKAEKLKLRCPKLTPSRPTMSNSFWTGTPLGVLQVVIQTFRSKGSSSATRNPGQRAYEDGSFCGPHKVQGRHGHGQKTTA